MGLEFRNFSGARENPNYNWQLLLQSWVDKGVEVDDKLEIANMDSSLIRLLDICEFSNKFLDRLRYDLQVSNVDYTETIIIFRK